MNLQKVSSQLTKEINQQVYIGSERQSASSPIGEPMLVPVFRRLGKTRRKRSETIEDDYQSSSKNDDQKIARKYSIDKTKREKKTISEKEDKFATLKHVIDSASSTG